MDRLGLSPCLTHNTIKDIVQQFGQISRLIDTVILESIGFAFNNNPQLLVNDLAIVRVAIQDEWLE